MKFLVVTSFLVVSLGTAAKAADAIVYEEVPVVAGFNWSGAYIGGQLGYVAAGDADYIYEDTDYNYSHGIDGFIGGVYAGYNFQFDNGFVLGGEADMAWGDVNGSSLAPGDPDYSATTEIDWTGAARLRLGYAMDRFLPYLSGGVAFAHFNYDEFDADGFYSGGDDNLFGWTLGVGGEYAVTDNWILRGEYRFTQYNDKDFVSIDEDEDLNVDIDTHDLRIGIAYKF